MIRQTISLPEILSEFVDQQVKSGQFGNVSEYYRTLVRRDQAQKELAISELRSLLDQAEASGISQLTMDEIRDKARKKLKA